MCIYIGFVPKYRILWYVAYTVKIYIKDFFFCLEKIKKKFAEIFYFVNINAIKILNLKI